MNNSQFRKLVLDTPGGHSSVSGSNGSSGTKSSRDGATPNALGSRMRSSIPMTPRSVASAGGIDFARQLAERNATNQPTKKFRATATPKGVKLPEGYVDRTKERVSEEEDDKAARVKALEEMMKLQQIDLATFEKLRDEIVGGDVHSVHLVKGLDYKLLKRVRRGEDVLNETTEGGDGADRQEGAFDADRELEMLEDKEIAPAKKVKISKKGEMAPKFLVPGKKRNRDQILAELKAARRAAKENEAPSLGSKFKKVGAPRATSRIELDGKGKEILITVDEDGREKRKVRKVQPEQKLERGHGLLMPDKDSKPLGMEVPEIPRPIAAEEEDMNIFDEAGDDYDPLACLEEDDSEVEEGETTDDAKKDQEGRKATAAVKEKSDISGMPPPPRPRNYFNDTKSTDATEDIASHRVLSDPAILAALKKASTLNPISFSHGADGDLEEAARAARRKKMLEIDDRDAQDMDMGFGSSRFEDAEDFGDDGKKVKLSHWGAGDDGEDGEEGKGSKAKRKRGPKKRKGDKDSATDVLKVLERQKMSKS